jgi:hypothetical protein
MIIRPVKKIFVITGLFLFTITGIAFTQTDKDKKHKNLKVLSKDISHNELNRVRNKIKNFPQKKFVGLSI